MDPQQRLLLEVAWEALEHAGVSPDSLAGTATGVFSVCNSDHYQRVIAKGIDAIDAIWLPATPQRRRRSHLILPRARAGLSIDTACSSSLVAVHLACRSLRSGESKVAIAAGVNVICTPENHHAQQSAHWRPMAVSKTFDDSADGFARGEGCGVLVLKPLSAALADGNRGVCGAAWHRRESGWPQRGLTVPNGPAQEAVIRAALADAGLSPADIDYVEARYPVTSLAIPSKSER